MMPKKLWQILLGAVATVVVLPLAIDWLIIGNSFPSNITNSDWVGFFGGYIGSILGCVISLVGILWTINFTREQNRADRELQVRPCFDIRYGDKSNPEGDAKWLGLIMVNVKTLGNNGQEIEEYGVLHVKNVGNGPATNIQVKIIPESCDRKISAYFTNSFTWVDGNSICQNEEARITIQRYADWNPPSVEEIKWDVEHVCNYNMSKHPTPERYKFKVSITYQDLMCNEFQQDLLFETYFYVKIEPKKSLSLCSDSLLIDVHTAIKCKMDERKVI